MTRPITTDPHRLMLLLLQYGEACTDFVMGKCDLAKLRSIRREFGDLIGERFTQDREPQEIDHANE